MVRGKKNPKASCNMRTLTGYGIAVIIVLAILNGISWLVDNPRLHGLSVFGSFLCTTNPLPTIGSSLSGTTTSITGTVLTLAQLVEKYYYTPTPGGPPCRAQPPLGSTTTGQNQTFPNLQPLP